MSQINTREIVLLNTSGTTTSSTGPDINLIQGWQAAIISLNLSTVSGTNPTFDVYIQKKLGQAASADTAGIAPTGTPIYDDLLHFTQMTTTGIRITQVCTGSQVPTANATGITTADWLQQDAGITAGVIRIGPIGGLWRVKFVLGGTSPTVSMAMVATLIPFST
jgi:hypothetical protein